jgi:hypothetical protein
MVKAYNLSSSESNTKKTKYSKDEKEGKALKPTGEK